MAIDFVLSIVFILFFIFWVCAICCWAIPVWITGLGSQHELLVEPAESAPEIHFVY